MCVTWFCGAWQPPAYRSKITNCARSAEQAYPRHQRARFGRRRSPPPAFAPVHRPPGRRPAWRSSPQDPPWWATGAVGEDGRVAWRLPASQCEGPQPSRLGTSSHNSARRKRRARSAASRTFASSDFVASIARSRTPPGWRTAAEQPHRRERRWRGRHQPGRSADLGDVGLPARRPKRSRPRRAGQGGRGARRTGRMAARRPSETVRRGPRPAGRPARGPPRPEPALTS